MREDVMSYLSAMREISRHLNLGYRPALFFFGRFEDFATAQLDDRAEADKRTLAGLYAAARIRFKQRYPSAIINSDLDVALHGADWELGNQYQPYQCPACPVKAVVIGDLSVDVDADADVSDGEVTYHATAFVEFRPTAFECEGCGQRLADSLLAAAGFPDSWVLDDVDPEAVPRDQAGSYSALYEARF
jgi:hypothetical protein